MDSLTQIALGAAMGELAMGRKIAGKAALYGAVIATLPDLDVLVPMGGPVADFTYHRSWSHSVIVLAAVAPLFALAIHRWRKDPPDWLRGWTLLTFLTLITHPLLDAFTIYGTQLLWPLTEHPFGLGSIFIIDPLYTVPLLAGVVVALRRQRVTPGRWWANVTGLTVSSLYLAWTVAAQSYAHTVMQRGMVDGIPGDFLQVGPQLTIPSPFNTFLWRSIVIFPHENTYAVGYHSFLDGTDRPRFKLYRSHHDLMSELKGHWPAERLAWFSKGFFNVEARDGDVIISDLRMGVEGRYVFTFKVAERRNTSIVPTSAERIRNRRDLNGLGRVWNRIWDASVEVVPKAGG